MSDEAVSAREVESGDDPDSIGTSWVAEAGRKLRAHSSAEPMIRAEALERTFGSGSAKSRAVAGVSFEVMPQEVVLLFGPSGSGKSTLLALIGGLDRQYTGQLSLFGKDLATLSDKELSHLRGERIGFVFQAFHLLDHVSVLDNVQAPGLFANPPLSDAQARARRALERVGLADKAGARPSELSGGQRQRVAIARALLRQPELLLCDEPTGNLDRQTGESIIDLFAELHAELGTTFVIVTHEHRLDRIASRTLHLEDGRLVKNETSATNAEEDA